METSAVRMCLPEGRGLHLPHPLYLLQPLLILSQLSHERLVPEPSLVQLVAVFPGAIASRQHFLMNPAIQLCRAERGLRRFLSPSVTASQYPSKESPGCVLSRAEWGRGGESMQIRLTGEDPRALSWIKDAYVVPQYQIPGLCQPRLHTRNHSGMPGFTTLLLKQPLQSDQPPAPVPATARPRPRDGGTAQWVKALPSLKT